MEEISFTCSRHVENISPNIFRHFPTFSDISRHFPTFPDISRHFPDIPTSRHPDIPTSRHPDIPTSRHPDIPTSRHPDIPTSRHPDIPTSRHPDIPTSRRHRTKLPTSSRELRKFFCCDVTMAMVIFRHAHTHRMPQIA